MQCLVCLEVLELGGLKVNFCVVWAATVTCGVIFTAITTYCLFPFEILAIFSRVFFTAFHASEGLATMKKRMTKLLTSIALGQASAPVWLNFNI